MAIEPVDPDPTWARQFVEIGRWLRQAFGDRALRIDHIGSTAVPGVPAKDVTDVQLTVETFEGVRCILEGSAFALRTGSVSDHRPAGSELPDRDLVKLFGEASEPRRANLHVRLPGRFNQRYAILCRDYLPAHRAAAQAYGEVERQLARIVGDDVDAYYQREGPRIRHRHGGRRGVGRQDRMGARPQRRIAYRLSRPLSSILRRNSRWSISRTVQPNRAGPRPSR